MNELEKTFQKKLDLLNNFKVMFFENKEYFKNYLHSFTLTQQAKIMAFFQVNDSKFYKEVNEFIRGEK